MRMVVIKATSTAANIPIFVVLFISQNVQMAGKMSGKGEWEKKFLNFLTLVQVRLQQLEAGGILAVTNRSIHEAPDVMKFVLLFKI